MLTGNKVAGQLDLSAPLITPLHMYTNPVQFNRLPSHWRDEDRVLTSI